MRLKKPYQFILFSISFNLLVISSYAYYNIFDLEGISESCEKSLNNALKSLPEHIRWFLLDAKEKGIKLKFKKVTLKEAQQTVFSGTTHGIPTAYASSDTIFITEDYCPLRDRNLVHEVGHIVHGVIRANYPTLAQEWSRLWHDIYRKHGSPSNPLTVSCPLNDCAFIGWKDLDNEHEGFAQLIVLSTYEYRQIWKDNKNPDFLRKLDFLNELRPPSRQINHNRNRGLFQSHGTR